MLTTAVDPAEELAVDIASMAAARVLGSSRKVAVELIFVWASTTSLVVVLGVVEAVRLKMPFSNAGRSLAMVVVALLEGFFF